MQRVFYADQTFLTDERVAEALLGYARVLATVGQADVVQVPGVDEDGKLRLFELVVGPASQMLSRDTDDETVEMDVAGTVRDLTDRLERRLPPSDARVFAGLPADDPEAGPLESEGSPSSTAGE